MIERLFCAAILSLALSANQSASAEKHIEFDDVQALRDSLITLENALYEQLDSNVGDNAPFGQPMLSAYGGWLNLDVPQVAKKIDSKSLSVWIEAAYMVFFHSLNSDVFRQGQQLFRELETRGASGLADARRVAEMAISAREFAFLKQVTSRHPQLGFKDIPIIEYSGQFDDTRPAVLEVKQDGALLKASNFEFKDDEPSLLFVFHPNCNFSRNAAEHLQSLNHFDCFSSSQGDWIAPMHMQDESQSILSWNKENPESPVRIVYNPNAWAPVYFTETPTFYLLEGDKILSSVHGWRPDTTPSEVSDMIAAFLTRSKLEHCQPDIEAPNHQQ